MPSHDPNWQEDTEKSDKQVIIFRCSVCGRTHPVARLLYDQNKAFPPATPHAT